MYPTVEKFRFGKLPNAVTRNARVSDAGLVYLAYRVTFADDRSFYSPNERELARLLKSGFGKDVRERARRSAKLAGYLQRRQSKLSGGKFSYARERLSFPEAAEGDYRIVWRGWFDGTLDLKAMAALLYINAGSGRGESFSREVGERFHWSKPTVGNVLKDLCAKELVRQIRRKNSRGQFESTVYQATIKKPGDGYPGPGQTGNIRMNTLHALKNLNEEGHCPSLRERLRTISYESSNLLGWADGEHGYGPSDLASAEAEFIDRITEAATDVTVARDLRSATGGRASREILSPGGAYTVRVLAAFVLQHEESFTPQDALQYVLDAIWNRVGSREGQWMNSFGVIGQRLFWAAYQSGFGDPLFSQSPT